MPLQAMLALKLIICLDFLQNASKALASSMESDKNWKVEEKQKKGCKGEKRKGKAEKGLKGSDGQRREGKQMEEKQLGQKKAWRC